jgi:hypothetical protein
MLGGGAVVAWALLGDLPRAVERHGWPVLLALTLGSTVGASEVVSRYRDEPVRAILSNAGLMYLGLNGVVSALTYGLLTRYSSSFAQGLQGDRVMTAMVAGFGAMAVLRSKFFTIRTPKGEDISVGPDAAVSAILEAADRGVDRSRASRRLSLVYRAARRITDAKVGAEFFQISLAAFQNLDATEKAEVIAVIDEILETDYPPELQIEAMCYVVLRLTGELNFNDIMANLQDFLRRGMGDGASATAGSPDDTDGAPPDSA